MTYMVPCGTYIETDRYCKDGALCSGCVEVSHLRNEISRLHSNDKKRFEAWATLSSMNLAKDSDDEYFNLAVHGAWSAWQAAQSDVDYINWRDG